MALLRPSSNLMVANPLGPRGGSLNTGTDYGGLSGTSPMEQLAAAAPLDAQALPNLRIYGPGDFGNHYDGYDYLLMVNIGGGPLLNPMLNGVARQTFGWSNMAEFGGSGMGSPLGVLSPGEIFAALVPHTDGARNYSFGFGGQTFNTTFTGSSGFSCETNAEVAHVPEPAGLAAMAVGVLGLAGFRRRQADGGRVGSTAR